MKPASELIQRPTHGNPGDQTERDATEKFRPDRNDDRGVY